MRIFIAIFLLIFSIVLSGQNQKKADSLLNVLKASKPDTSRMNIFTALSSLFISNNPDTAIYFAKQGLSLAQKTNNKNGVALCSYNIGMAYYNRGIYDKTLEYYQKALGIFEELTDKKRMSDCYNNIGNVNTNQGNYSQAIEYYQMSLKIDKALLVSSDKLTVSASKKGMSNCYMNIGTVYMYQGNYPNAIENYQKSLKISEDLVALIPVEGKKGMSNCYMNIGIIYYYQAAYPKAIEYYQKSLQIAEELSDKNSMALCYMNIGSTNYCQAEELRKHNGSPEKVGLIILKALDYYHKSIKIAEELGDKKGMSNCYMGLGIVYYFQGKYSQSIEYYQKSLKIAEELGDKNGISMLFGNIAELNNDLKKYDEAIEYAEKSLKIAKEIGSPEDEKKAHNILSESFKSQGNYKEALEHYELFKTLNDSIFNKEKQQQITKMEAIYQSEKKQKEIVLKNTQLDKKEIEVKQQKTQKYAFIGAFALMLILVLVVFKSYKDKQKANILLAEQKHQIEEKNNVLNLKNEEINQQKEELIVQAEQLEIANQELAKLSIVASETDNAVIIAEKSGVIEWVNQGAIKMFGENILETIGKNLLDLSANSEIFTCISKCIHEKTSVKYESPSILGKNRLFTQTTLTPVIDNNGEVTKIIAIDSDITEITEIKEKIERQNTQILDSIKFAQLIQEAIFPSEEMIKNNFPESYIFFKPRDIVSGDFYWMHKEKNKILLALVDCTGHGVPGAFMSMIGNAILNQIIKEKRVSEPARILKLLNREVSNMLNQGGHSYDAGMDVTMCCIDRENRQMTVSLAGHTIHIYENGELLTKDGGMFEIGGLFSKTASIDYESHTIPINDNMTIYLSSDGYYDQFGGPENFKFTETRFKQMLRDIGHLDMEQQKDRLSRNFEDWKGDERQVDDILVMGIRI